MLRGQKFLIGYFLVFGALSAIAIIPGGTLIVLIVTAMMLPLFGMPGFLVAAAPTILLYSASLVPLWAAAATTRPGRRLWLVGAAALIPAMVAMVPGLLSRLSVGAFATRVSLDDFHRPAQIKPNTIELVGDFQSGLFVYAREIGDKYASCNDLCLRLLFDREVEWVRVTRIPDLYMNARSGTTRSVTYHIERRTSCPQVSADGVVLDKAVRDRLVAGDCLIADAGGDTAPAAVVKFITPYFEQHYPPKPHPGAPAGAGIESVKELQVAERRNGALAPIVRQTETTARTLALPFYFGIEMHMQGGYNGPTIGRVKTVIKPVDLTQMLREIFGFKLGPVAPPPPEDAGAIAERILSLPNSVETFSAQQQDLIGEALKPLLARAILSDADVERLRRVVQDQRVTSGQIGVTLQSLIRKHADRLAPLIPAVIERLTVPVPEAVGHYQSLLGWALANYPAAALEPHREKITAILEEQSEWPTAGLLTRIAELGGEPTGLIVRRLSAKSDTVQRSAAVAACRAPDDQWGKLEPAMIDRLPDSRAALRDADGAIMLALIRHGQKSLVDQTLERSAGSNKERFRKRLERYQPGFSAAQCGDSL